MNSDKFKVTANRGIWGNLMMVGTIAFVTLPFIGLFVMLDNTAVLVMGLPFFAISVVLFIHNIAFYIKVDGNQIKGRTSRGRGYQFQVSDITKVTCSHKTIQGAHGVGTRQNYMTITADSERIEIKDSMGGFETMAAYLLHKSETGELSSSAISGYAKRLLGEYAEDKNKDDSGRALFVVIFVLMVVWMVILATR